MKLPFNLSHELEGSMKVAFERREGIVLAIVAFVKVGDGMKRVSFFGGALMLVSVAHTGNAKKK